MRYSMTALALALAAHNCSGVIAADTKASFYSAPQPQACGGRFNPNLLTAAHRSLACGTRIEITNKTNGRSVVVTITDRGPAEWTGRGLDLSRAAADAIGMRDAGVVPVTYRIIERSPTATKGDSLRSRYVDDWVQARRFRGCDEVDPCQDD